MKGLIWITLVLILLVLFDISQEMQLSETDKVKLQEQKMLEIKQQELIKAAEAREQQFLLDQQGKLAALSWAEVPDDRRVEWLFLKSKAVTITIGLIILSLSVVYSFHLKAKKGE